MKLKQYLICIMSLALIISVSGRRKSTGSSRSSSRSYGRKKGKTSKTWSGSSSNAGTFGKSSSSGGFGFGLGAGFLLGYTASSGNRIGYGNGDYVLRSKGAYDTTR